MHRIGILVFVKIGLIVILSSVFYTITFAADKALLMATTTSTDNTGLLDYLSPHFTKATGIRLKWIAVGTGKALKMGENCDVDLLLVHAPESEKKFVEEGFGTDRREIMYNDFILIGPKSDPAEINGKSTGEALSTIRIKRAVFVSRGDNSGTHKKEISLWLASNQGIPDKEKWYVQTGQGMLASITIAAEQNGYILTDRGTYIKYEADKEGNPPLKILVEGDDNLKNQYSVIVIDVKHCPGAEHQIARRFSDWLAGQKAQNLIKDFTLMEKRLFIPNAK
jgi:tungstate transport system substrate-binding protein